jgi:uncharacterized protein (TIGR02145 family)
MKKSKQIIAAAGVFLLLLSFGNTSVAQTTTKTTQTTTKSKQTTTKSGKTSTKSTSTKPKSTTTSTKPATDTKAKDAGTVKIGNQTWAVANLNVSTFRNGDTIPEAKTNQEWVKAGESGKPAWCYYNNDPANGKKYGKLYNWFAVNDPRELAPAGWSLSNDADWAELATFLGGHEAAGTKLKSTSGWTEGYNGSNESGFNGLPGGYRIENGTFLNLTGIATWWSATEGKNMNGNDHYLALRAGIGKSSNPKQRGESVRCIRK